MDEPAIVIEACRVHNLKAVSCTLPHNRFYCLTGVSGSGKSSFAFDTIFVEGQRRYVESLSHQAKRLFSSLPKPDLESITGLTPTISIEQKSSSHNPRSTVGTVTEIYDYLRVLFARFGVAYCPVSHERVATQTKEELTSRAFKLFQNIKTVILAPKVRQKKGSLQDTLEEIQRQGFSRIRLDGTLFKIDDIGKIDETQEHDIDIVIDRITISKENEIRSKESFLTALQFGNGMMILMDQESQNEEFFSINAYSLQSGISYPPLEPHHFSFNSIFGMCQECHGLGSKQLFDCTQVVDGSKSIREDPCIVASSYKTIRYKNIFDNLASIFSFSLDTPFEKLSKEAQNIYLYGTEKKWTRMVFVHPETGAVWHDNVMWKGVLNEAYVRYQEATSELFKRKMERWMIMSTCPVCHGSRLQPYPSHVQFCKKTIQEIAQLSIKEAFDFFKTLQLPKEIATIAQELIDSIVSRLHFLNDVGLSYLTIDRAAPTLSGGEAQRVRLASQIASGLIGITYVLDEPSIGLHPKDNEKLIQALKTLQERGNTLFVVEHDEETMRACDTILDFGPGAGEQGGKLIFQGAPDEIASAPFSYTKEYLLETSIGAQKNVRNLRKSSGTLTITGAKLNNLKNVSLNLPLGLFIGVTGVSGSGKSSLFLETLYPALSNILQKSALITGPFEKIINFDLIEKVIQIDQTAIGRTPRSNPATYSKVFDEIRALFAALPESQAKGWEAGRYSFNVKEGSCQECSGVGMIQVDMDFLEESWVECPSCLGQRFENDTLSICYKGKNIQEVLDMTCREALDFFDAIPKIKKILSTLCEVGLDYLRLGQSSTTLSGGEAQRLKLAKELHRPDSGKTLYLLDEPTTGLHFHDIQNLLNLLNKLVDRGNSLVVIEHNMDLIKECDWVIDMGPGSGTEGGNIIFEGTLVELTKKKSATGIAIKKHLTSKKNKSPKRTEERQPSTPQKMIQIRGACHNSLKNIDVDIPRHLITTIVGPSGSGKSSLAFDTLYAEGQRRYVESLSPYARQFVQQMPKPKLESIQGICPAIAIEQRQHAGNPRSTVGTITEIYDYLRIFWAQTGQPFCPKTGKPIHAVSRETIANVILSYPEKTKIEIFAPITFDTKKSTFAQKLLELQRDGYTKLRLDGVLYNIDEITDFKKKKNYTFDLIIDRITPNPEDLPRIMSSLQAAERATISTIGLWINGKERICYSLGFSVEGSDEIYPELSAKTFAFNTKQGMCHDCSGLGYQLSLDVTSLPLPQKASIRRLLSFLQPDEKKVEVILKILEKLNISEKTLLSDLSSHESSILYHGSFQPIEWGPHGETIEWAGINQAIEFSLKRGDIGTKEQSGNEELSSIHGLDIRQAITNITCPTCLGSRLNLFANNVRIDDLSITDFCNMTTHSAHKWLTTFTSNKKLTKAMTRVIEEIMRRLQCMKKIGVDYLSLSRMASTLSGGEAQRVRLVSQIGSGLTGVLYVLDEPSVGLHPEDSEKLIDAIYDLKKLQNSVVIVEHDPLMMAISDHIIELGPESGKEGGKIVFEGEFEALKNAASKTGAALRMRKAISKIRKKKQPLQNGLTILHASLHNLKIRELTIPSEKLVSIAGVSGSGKSTLLFDVLLQGFHRSNIYRQEQPIGFKIEGLDHFQHVVAIDQKPMSHNSRSDLASFTDLFTPIRHFFGSLPDAVKLGLTSTHFSRYHKNGMCSHCWGLGYKRISMHFMPSVQIVCPECLGKRINPISLSVRYKGHSIGDILSLTVEEALLVFNDHPKIMRLLTSLINVGLGYIPLGQEMATLSTGEAQRVKIATALAKKSRGKTLFLMDEPTTGLHLSEVSTLTVILKEMVQELGHTVIAIEHNVDFLSHSDYIIEMGPGAGEDGGAIIATGTIEEILRSKESRIKKYISTL